MSLSVVGIFHTLLGLFAVFSAIWLIIKFQRITISHPLGKLYAIATALTAGSAFFIFNHGGLNIAHGLAALTLAALLVAILLSFFKVFGTLTPYFQLTAMSSTLLFHFIPAATEILMRFPLSDPMVKSFEDPLLHQTFLAIFIMFLLLLVWQIARLKRTTIYIR